MKKLINARYPVKVTAIFYLFFLLTVLNFFNRLETRNLERNLIAFYGIIFFAILALWSIKNINYKEK